MNFFLQDMEGATVLILWAAFGWLCLPAPTSPLPSYFLDTKCHKPRLTCSTVMLLMKPGPVTHPYQFPFAAPVITEIPTSHYGGETPLEKTTCFHQCGSYFFVCDQYENILREKAVVGRGCWWLERHGLRANAPNLARLPQQQQYGQSQVGNAPTSILG